VRLLVKLCNVSTQCTLQRERQLFRINLDEVVLGGIRLFKFLEDFWRREHGYYYVNPEHL
jgi:hypothetical protein